MSQRTVPAYEPLVAAYDAVDSPGPYPDVVEKFRPRRRGEVQPWEEAAERELTRYTVLLVLPEHADALGFDRDDAGLKLYLDGEYDEDLTTLHEAASMISEVCDTPVTLIEHRAELTYWTARRTPAE